ncbi:hypothetical protein BJ878DRAFT_483626 [Calycina marina]|uniref:Uncharacterized protein n=1 Tax=Calycina marina TaxID=1763456 RepID=A0A9P7YVE1_9HELO|nr:hypothetical protein BJ878DRAFT_483626 [Calycina marina]
MAQRDTTWMDPDEGALPEWMHFYIEVQTAENKRYRNAALAKEYKKAQAYFVLNMNGKLNSVDKELCKLQPSIKSRIEKLRAKYFLTTFKGSSRKIKEFTIWRMSTKCSPSDNWIALTLICQEAHRQTDETTFSNKLMWGVLINVLVPDSPYDNINDGLVYTDESVGSHLQRLDEKWIRISSKGKESSFIATNLTRQPRALDQDDEEASYVALGQKKGYLQGNLSRRR